VRERPRVEAMIVNLLSIEIYKLLKRKLRLCIVGRCFFHISTTQQKRSCRVYQPSRNTSNLSTNESLSHVHPLYILLKRPIGLFIRPAI
jgi:hypothetical protein